LEISPELLAIEEMITKIQLTRQPRWRQSIVDEWKKENVGAIDTLDASALSRGRLIGDREGLGGILHLAEVA